MAHERYVVRLAPSAQRALTDSLPASVAFAALELINGPLAERPYVGGSPLRAPFDGLFRARRGEYRVRYEMEETERRITILRIGHRRDVYRT